MRFGNGSLAQYDAMCKSVQNTNSIHVYACLCSECKINQSSSRAVLDMDCLKCVEL